MTSDEIRWARNLLKNLSDGNPQLANSFKQVLKIIDDHARLTALVDDLTTKYETACRLVNTDFDTITDMLEEKKQLTALVQSLSERCHKQSELLSQRAERDNGHSDSMAEISTMPGCNCGAGTSFGPMAGHWEHCKINTTNEEKQSS